MMSSSDCDGFGMDEVLSLASASEKADWLGLKLGYTETRGSIPLRKAIQKHYQNIELNEIIVTSPGEANFVLMNVLLSKGDEVVCMAPLYQSLYQIAKDIGCRLTLWEPIEDNGGWNCISLRSRICDYGKTRSPGRGHHRNLRSCPQEPGRHGGRTRLV